jgi:hypothetical protein
MAPPPSNIETVARDICARLYAKHWPAGPEVQADIDRHWHIVAAKLEAGLIGEDGSELGPTDFDRERAAVREWRARHPDYTVPPPRVALAQPAKSPTAASSPAPPAVRQPGPLSRR